MNLLKNNFDYNNNNYNKNIQLPKYTNHNGFLMPYGFPIDGFESGLQYKAQPNDLFIASYPKSGTTYVLY